MNDKYDSSWDTDTDNEDAFDRKYEEWERRNWMKWLTERLAFPFEVKRVEDMEENPYAPETGYFSVGRRMQATDIEEHWKYEIALKVASGKKKGIVPLADVEVSARENPNFWPVREYAVWAANR